MRSKPSKPPELLANHPIPPYTPQPWQGTSGAIFGTRFPPAVAPKDPIQIACSPVGPHPEVA